MKSVEDNYSEFFTYILTTTRARIMYDLSMQIIGYSYNKGAITNEAE
jgi:hypothetical protein